MFEKIPFTCEARDGLALRGFLDRDAEVPVRAALLIVHGMTEYFRRYDDFAAFLSSRGVAVFGFDLRGHGETTPDDENRGFFGERDGVDMLMSDISRVSGTVRGMLSGAGAGDVPFFLYGHSMGSFLVSCYVKRTHAAGLDGIILSGTTSLPGPVGLVKDLARLQCRIRGPKSKGRLITNAAFGSYNSKCRPKRTEKDWLTRDTAIVDAYVADPACMFTFTAAGLADLFALLGEIGTDNWTSAVPMDVPVLMVSGEMDPVGSYGKGPRNLEGWFRETGHDVELKLYPGGRHEMHNELNRDEVYHDVLSFIDLHC